MPGTVLVRAAALVAVGVLCTTGCGRDAPLDPVSPTELQIGLGQKLRESGTPANWVECANGLPARVGATTRCTVAFNGNASLTALLTTTRVDGGKATWEITEAQLTKEQVAQRVAAITGAKDVKCDFGMSGHVGNWVPCHSGKDVTALNQSAAIAEAKGLALKLNVEQFVPSQRVEDNLGTRLVPLYGRPPDLIECKADLPAVPGSSVQCVTKIDGKAERWTVTVTGVSQGNVDFEFARMADKRGTAG